MFTIPKGNFIYKYRCHYQRNVRTNASLQTALDMSEVIPTSASQVFYDVAPLRKIQHIQQKCLGNAVTSKEFYLLAPLTVKQNTQHSLQNPTFDFNQVLKSIPKSIFSILLKLLVGTKISALVECKCSHRLIQQKCSPSIYPLHPLKCVQIKDCYCIISIKTERMFLKVRCNRAEESKQIK